MEETSHQIIQEHKRIMSIRTRQKNKLKRILKKLAHVYGSTKPIVFDIDMLIGYVTEKGFPQNRIDKQVLKRGFVCTIDTRSGLQVSIRHDWDWKPHVYFIVDEYVYKISYYDEKYIANVVIEIDELGEKYRVRHEEINAYLNKSRQTPEKVLLIRHAFDVTDDVQFRMDVADRIIGNAVGRIQGMIMKERIYPYCDRLWAKNNVRYDIEYGNQEFTMIFNPQGGNDEHFRFDSKCEYIERELNDNAESFFEETSVNIAEHLIGLFTDIERKVEKYDKDEIASLLEFWRKPTLLSKYLNAPILPRSLKGSWVLRMPTFSVTLIRCEHEDISYKVNGEENVLYIPDSFEYNSATQDIIYKCLDEIFMEVAKILFPKRVKYLSEKTGLKYSKCRFGKYKSKYGSFCPEDGTLSLSYYLITDSQEYIDAVIIHELCHSVTLSHGLKFQKAMLKYAGRKLYDLDFNDSRYKKLL